MHVILHVLRWWLKITALIKTNFLLWSLKTVAKISFAFKMLLSLLRETERLHKGPEIGAMTQGLSLLASKAGNKDTFKFKWCKKNLTTGRAPHKKGESKNVSMARLDLGGLLSSPLKNIIFSTGQCDSMVRALALTSKGHGFNSSSRAYTWHMLFVIT